MYLLAPNKKDCFVPDTRILEITIECVLVIKEISSVEVKTTGIDQNMSKGLVKSTIQKISPGRA